jgi:hypothetical protein
MSSCYLLHTRHSIYSQEINYAFWLYTTYLDLLEQTVNPDGCRPQALFKNKWDFSTTATICHRPATTDAQRRLGISSMEYDANAAGIPAPPRRANPQIPPLPKEQGQYGSHGHLGAPPQ